MATSLRKILRRKIIASTRLSKTCTQCKQTKPLDQFSQDRSLRSGFRASCLICHSERNKKHQRTKRYWLNEQVLESGCIKCHYNTCAAALDFHHVNPQQKLFNIGCQGICASWKRLKKEVAKCVILCARCHRELHAGLFCLSSFLPDVPSSAETPKANATETDNTSPPLSFKKWEETLPPILSTGLVGSMPSGALLLWAEANLDEELS